MTLDALLAACFAIIDHVRRMCRTCPIGLTLAISRSLLTPTLAPASRRAIGLLRPPLGPPPGLPTTLRPAVALLGNARLEAPLATLEKTAPTARRPPPPPFA